ncbi:MAG: glycosyltransferase [Erysipelotrichaceae bacterium]|nr:glycosyltransferase [Erysipelotrichaceae bacterium]
MNELRVTALVVTYNRKELLQECLTAILSQTFAVNSVLVINNCSSDGTEELFKEGGPFCQEKIAFLTTEKNLGGAGGFAYGFEKARDYDRLWIMDDDTIPTETALEELLKAEASLTERPGFLASAVYGPKGEAMNVPVLDRRPSENGYEDWYRHLSDSLIKVRSATFVSLLISAEAVRKMGLPIAEYFLWGDDTEYTTRLSRYYGDSYLCGKSTVIHKRANAKRLSILTEEDPKRIGTFFYLYRNSLLTAKKYNPKGNSALHVCEFHLLALKCLFGSNVKERGKKFLTVEKAIFSYLFGCKEIKEKLRGIPHA